MRKLVALLAACVGVFLAVPSIAAAAIPQGALSGVGLLTSGGTNFQLGATVSDGGTSYVGLQNDRSGNCDGDSGTVVINQAVFFNVVCAHFISSSGCCSPGKPKMRFAYGSGPTYNVVRITDNGIPNAAGQSPDTVAVGFANSLTQAIAWVNTGAVGSGNPLGWTFPTLLPDAESFNSDYQVHQ